MDFVLVGAEVVAAVVVDTANLGLQPGLDIAILDDLDDAVDLAAVYAFAEEAIVRDRRRCPSPNVSWLYSRTRLESARSVAGCPSIASPFRRTDALPARS